MQLGTQHAELQGLRDSMASRHDSLVMQLRGIEHSIEGVADTGARTQAQLSSVQVRMCVTLVRWMASYMLKTGA